MNSFNKSIDSILNNVTENTLILIESTVHPGTCEKIIYPNLRIRVGGRVVEKSIKYNDLGITKFEIFGENNTKISVTHEGMLPNLFGPRTFIIAEGLAINSTAIRSKSVIVKHENEFLTDLEDADVYVPDYSR